MPMSDSAITLLLRLAWDLKFTWSILVVVSEVLNEGWFSIFPMLDETIQ